MPVALVKALKFVAGVKEKPAYPAEAFSAWVQTSKQSSTAPEALTPNGALPAVQFAALAAKAVAVPAFPDQVPAVLIVSVDAEEPMTDIGWDKDSGDEAVREVVATLPIVVRPAVLVM